MNACLTLAVTNGAAITTVEGLAANEGRAHRHDEIRELMSGSICRCGDYVNIVAAIEQVLGERPTRSWPEPMEARQVVRRRRRS